MKSATGFGSAFFVAKIIDEYYIIRNQIAIGIALSVFKERKSLNLVSTTSFKSGKILNKYLPQ